MVVVPFLVGTSQFHLIGVEWSLAGLGLELRPICIERRPDGLQNLTLSAITVLIGPFPSSSVQLSLFPLLFRFTRSRIHCPPFVSMPCVQLSLPSIGLRIMYHETLDARPLCRSCNTSK